MNAQNSKKELEVLIMQYFSSVFEGFPRGKVEPSESPDFIINLSIRNKLGIELTRLHPGSTKIVTPVETAISKSNTEIVAIAHELFCQKSSFKLFVKVLFSETSIIDETRKIQVAVALSNSVRAAMEKRNPATFFSVSISGEKMPAEIEKILVINHPVMTTSIWERANNFGVSNDVVADISWAIQKKDEKLRIYHRKKLNLYWLLITTDRLHGLKNFNLPQKIAKHEFNSRFQRVYLFDLLKSKIYQIV
jgi:hypothetical protein